MQQPFEYFLEHRIGNGRFQVFLGFALGFVYFQNSVMQIQTGLIMPEITREWSLSLTEQSQQFTLQLFLIAFGFLLHSVALTEFPRKPILLASVLLLMAFSVASALTSSYGYYTVVRSFAGLFYGISQSIVFVLQNEFFLKQDRIR